jgi:hypothetical protein
MKTEALIASLSKQATPVKALRSPRYWGGLAVGILGIYAFAVQYFLGLRPDLLMQLTRPLFALEVLLLTLLTLTSIVAAILAMYPDAYQKPVLLKMPYGVFAVLTLLMTVQLLLPQDAAMVMPPLGVHAMECALCIGAVALIPSALLFMMLRKGATVLRVHAGVFAVLAASGVGCLTLRLAEMNDSIEHLLEWHYVPTLLFAALGALIGKGLLRW